MADPNIRGNLGSRTRRRGIPIPPNLGRKMRRTTPKPRPYPVARGKNGAGQRPAAPPTQKPLPISPAPGRLVPGRPRLPRGATGPGDRQLQPIGRLLPVQPSNRAIAPGIAKKVAGVRSARSFAPGIRKRGLTVSAPPPATSSGALSKRGRVNKPPRTT